MTSVLKYGSDSQITFELPPETLIAECGKPAGDPIDDPSAAMAAGLISPWGLPPLAECVLPDDRVAIVLHDELPRADELLIGAVKTFLEAKVDPTGISILISDRYANLDLEPVLRASTGHDITVKRHNPSDRDELAYLGTSGEGKPILLNRTIVDAEFVLPIGCLRVDSAPGYYGVDGTVFPAFGDEEARKRFGAPSNEEWAAHRRRRREEVEEVARLLGVVMTVQIAPGSRGELLQVIVGEPGTIKKRARDTCDAIWNYKIPRRASLVIAAIEGGAECQTWDNVALATAAASAAVADGGAIALCTDLDSPPGAALQRLTELRDFETTLLELKKDRSPDVTAATQLLQALQQYRVYLLSNLDDELVEDLGMAPIGDETELVRLSQRYETCILLSNAQFAVALPEEDALSLEERD